MAWHTCVANFMLPVKTQRALTGFQVSWFGTDFPSCCSLCPNAFSLPLPGTTHTLQVPLKCPAFSAVSLGPSQGSSSSTLSWWSLSVTSQPARSSYQSFFCLLVLKIPSLFKKEKITPFHVRVPSPFDTLGTFSPSFSSPCLAPPMPLIDVNVFRIISSHFTNSLKTHRSP